jgi:hypothetical protein
MAMALSPKRVIALKSILLFSNDRLSIEEQLKSECGNFNRKFAIQWALYQLPSATIGEFRASYITFYNF